MNTFLFDMDGTLFDTEKYYNRAWKQAIFDAGYELSDEEVLKLRSLGRPFAVEQFEAWFGSEADYWAIREHRKELMKEFLSGQIPLKPAVPETLEALKAQGCRLAVVTATNPEQAEHNLVTAEIRQHFDAVICATMVERGKPAPDVYEYACHTLGVAPEDCYAVEDSPNGVRSAYGAGCRVIMIPDLTQPDKETGQLLYRKLDTFGALINIPAE